MDLNFDLIFVPTCKKYQPSDFVDTRRILQHSLMDMQP